MSTGDLSWRETLWGTADGRLVEIKEMTLGHLVNVLNWVQDLPDKYNQKTKDVLLKEAEYRKFLGFASKKPYPEYITNRWVMFDPKTGLIQIQPPPKQYINKVKDNERYQELKATVDEKRISRKG